MSFNRIKANRKITLLQRCNSKSKQKLTKKHFLTLEYRLLATAGKTTEFSDNIGNHQYVS